MSLQHFKQLYEIAKNDGVASALKYDLIETAVRHPELVVAGALTLHKVVCNFRINSDDNYFEDNI